MAKSTKPITPAKRKKIIADYAACGNYSEVGRKYGLAPNTIKSLVKKDPAAAKLCEQKAQEQSLDAVEYLSARGEKITSLLDKMIDAMEVKVDNLDMFTNLKDIATAFGIVVDKAFKAAEIKAAANQTAKNGMLETIIEAVKRIE